MGRALSLIGTTILANLALAMTTTFDNIQVNSLNGTPISTNYKFYWGDLAFFPASFGAGPDMYVIGGANRFWGSGLALDFNFQRNFPR